MKKIVLLMVTLCVSTMLISACGEKKEDETVDVIDNCKTVAKEVSGVAEEYQDVKRLIASILDYNNIVDDVVKRITITFKDEDYSKVEDLTYLMSVLDENLIYKVTTTYDDKSELPTNIIISDAVEDVDLIDENSIDDELEFEENE